MNPTILGLQAQGFLIRFLHHNESGILETRHDPLKIAQRLQCPLLEVYSLSHIRDPTIISGIFLNDGILESLGIGHEHKLCTAPQQERCIGQLCPRRFVATRKITLYPVPLN